ncbi:hypothetical protein EVAR_54177_1 [Eumeta japonica]|uniref:Uncharacterized protein n=1 Tax=Eumeta variegata TaxID=151549 RepID=A0A4C1Y3V8_EUMVA|nr:hypothetical protein EVAR_54177_1 [Eumeta japonica]
MLHGQLMRAMGAAILVLAALPSAFHFIPTPRPAAMQHAKSIFKITPIPDVFRQPTTSLFDLKEKSEKRLTLQAIYETSRYARCPMQIVPIVQCILIETTHRNFVQPRLHDSLLVASVRNIMNKN